MNWNPFRRKPKGLDMTNIQKELEKSPPPQREEIAQYRFRTQDHPEANGRAPLLNEHAYTFHFNAEDGSKISLEVGEKGFQSLSQVIMDMLTSAPSYDISSGPAFTKVESPEAIEHKRKMKIVHAIWLNAYIGEKGCDTDLVIARASKMLGIPEENLFDGFDHDYIDRAWCSRPNDWKPQDSLA